MNNSKIILAALVSSKLDLEEYLAPIRKKLLSQGNEILHELIQRRGVSRSKTEGGSKNMDAPLNPKTYLGSGKILELKDIVSEKNPDAVLFLNELSGSQVSSIESIIECEVELLKI